MTQTIPNSQDPKQWPRHFTTFRSLNIEADTFQQSDSLAMTQTLPNNQDLKQWPKALLNSQELKQRPKHL